MPAYNEEECIEEVVTNWANQLKQIFPKETDFRMLIINDGSRDRTGEILDELSLKVSQLRVVHQTNSGHGEAVLNGYERAIALSPNWVFQTDSDNQFRPSDFLKLWEAREKSLFLTGYRQQRNDDFNRLVITRILRGVIRITYGCSVKDSNVPYRLIQTDYLESLFKQLPGRPFAPNIFLAILAARDGQNLFEFPISHLARETGQVSIVKWTLIKVCMRSFRELVWFRLTLRQRLQSIREIQPTLINSSK